MRATAGLLQSGLERWDKRAAASADVYLANSTVVAERIKTIYGIDAEVVPPPPAITPEGHCKRSRALKPAFSSACLRLLPYKNVDAIVDAFVSLPEDRLVIAGSGPFERQLRASAGTNVTFVGQVTDAQVSWLYANCRALVAASYEDFGMTPVEAATFGKPTVALRWGGFLDTIDEGRTGVFFDAPTGEAVADALCRASIDEIGMRTRSANARRASRTCTSSSASPRPFGAARGMNPDAHKNGAFVLWLTGLSGAGKTTLARLLEAEFADRGLGRRGARWRRRPNSSLERSWLLARRQRHERPADRVGCFADRPGGSDRDRRGYLALCRGARGRA